MKTVNPSYRGIALFAALAVTSFSSFAQEGEKAAVAIDAKAKGIIDAAVARYSAAESVVGEATMSIKQTMPEAFGGGSRDTVVTHVVTRKGENFSQTTKGESEMSLYFYVKGEDITLKLDEETAIQGKVTGGANAAVKSEAFGFQKEAGSNMILDQHVPSAFLRRMILNDEKNVWDANITGMKYVGEEEIDGVKVDKVTLTSKQSAGMGDAIEMDTDVWITQGDAPELVKIQPDMKKVIETMAKENPAFGEMKIEMIGTYTKPVLGGEIPADAFDVALAEGSKKFESFAKLIEEMQAGQGGDRPDPKELEGKDAPDFELDMLDGSNFKLSENKGSVVILDFWATWCGPCVQALPVLMKVSAEFADKGVKLIGVNQQEDKGTIEGFLKKKEWDLKVALDKGSAAQMFMVSGIPQTVIVGKDGKVAKVHVGFSPGLETSLREELEKIVGE
jgi:thiol-disulfide isomerase/thioredoxin